MNKEIIQNFISCKKKRKHSKSDEDETKRYKSSEDNESMINPEELSTNDILTVTEYSSPTVKFENDSENEEFEQYAISNNVLQHQIDERFIPQTSSLNSTNDITTLLLQILQNQENFERSTNQRLDNIEKLLEKGTIDQMAIQDQTTMIRESLVINRQMLKITKHLSGDVDEEETNISTILPLTTQEELQTMDKILEETEFLNTMLLYLRKLKSICGSFDAVFRQIISDSLLDKFNWDGRCNKQVLRNFKLFNKILFEVFSNLGRQMYEKQIRKSIELSHNRYKHVKPNKTQVVKKENPLNRLK